MGKLRTDVTAEMERGLDRLRTQQAFGGPAGGHGYETRKSRIRSKKNQKFNEIVPSSVKKSNKSIEEID